MAHLDNLRRARASLATLFEPDDPHLRQMLAAHGPVDAVTLLVAEGRPPAAGRRADPPGLRVEQVRHVLAAVVAAADGQRHGGRIVIPEDDDWPTGLTDLAAERPDGAADRPAAPCLWVRGDRPVNATLARAVTVTGARAATSYGQHIATELGRDLADRGWTVLASGAFGVDAAAHRGALAVAGPTVALLPGGVDRPYPAPHATLFHQIANEGLLVSAWPPGATPTRSRFTTNQRLLAALAAGTVVVEATPRSRALHALRAAITLGRPAMVVPGPVTSAMSAGCHQALRQHPQARLVTGIDDVLTELTRPAATPHQ